MISIEEARRIITEELSPLPARVVPLERVAGCVLREDVAADAAYPASDCSTMDGYAVAADDLSERFNVVMTVAAGTMPTCAIGAGECARIFTGATLPVGATQVIRQEDTRREGDVMIPERRDGKRFVRQRGAEALAGDVVLRAGVRIGGAESAILAQVGKHTVAVSPVVRVIHVATGDELVDPATNPTAGQIRDSNSSMLRALLWSDESEISSTRCGDKLDTIVKRVSEESSPSMVLISGGASVGEHDLGARALRELGFEIHFDRVNLRPGKPLTFATRDGLPAFVIPGNPVSHFVCYQVAIRLAIERLVAVQPAWSFVSLPLLADAPVRGGDRESFLPARVLVHERRLVVTPQRWTTSGDTFSLAGTNALMRVVHDMAPGSEVPTLLIGPHF